MSEKVSKLLSTIDELQASESTSQLTARRAERELKGEKEAVQRLERELEAWRAARAERASNFGSGEGLGIEVPQRKSSLSRVPSMTKGFL